MNNRERRAVYVSLAVLALAFGWIETSVVVYLREIHVQTITLEGTRDPWDLHPLPASLLDRLFWMEVAREACTMVVLVALAWSAGRRVAERIGAFLLSFGLWNLTYSASLWLVLGQPKSVRTWDILFFVPLPWVAPAWAPLTIAVIFAVTGSYLLWTSDRERRYRWSDIGVIAISLLLTIAAFFQAWSAAANQGVPDRFPAPLFWAGVALGVGWFARLERRAALEAHTRKPLVNVQSPPLLPKTS